MSAWTPLSPSLTFSHLSSLANSFPCTHLKCVYNSKSPLQLLKFRLSLSSSQLPTGWHLCTPLAPTFYLFAQSIFLFGPLGTLFFHTCFCPQWSLQFTHVVWSTIPSPVSSQALTGTASTFRSMVPSVIIRTYKFFKNGGPWFFHLWASHYLTQFFVFYIFDNKYYNKESRELSKFPLFHNWSIWKMCFSLLHFNHRPT